MARGRNTIAVVSVVILFEGCAAFSRAAAVDRDIDFEAHPGYRELVIDRMDGAQNAVLVPAHQPEPAGATHLLEANGKTVAALWVADDDVVVVRQRPDATAPLLGEVVASSTQGATRITFYLPGGASFHTSPFERIDGENLPNVLGHRMLHWLSVPGVYRAELYDSQGAPVGWFRVQIFPYQGLPRHFDGDVPGSVNGSLAAGAVALLNSQIDSLERTVFPDDY